MKNGPVCTPPRKLTQEKFVNLFSTEIVSAKGRVPWIFASRKPSPGAAGAKADAVVVVSTVMKDGEPHLVLAREFRAPLAAYELSLPSGLIDEGESEADAAIREFHEETGLRLVRVIHVSPPLASSAGITDETVSLVYGEAEGAISRAHQTEHEDIEVFAASLEEIRMLVGQPGGAVMSSRLYPILLGFVAAGRIALPGATGV